MLVICAPAARAAQTINTSSTTSCAAQGGSLVGGNILTDFDNGTFGSENGAVNQSPSTNPYPGQIMSGTFSNFYSFFYGAYGYVANPVDPRNSFQHPDITDPLYGATGRFFASDPDVDTPIINFTALNVNPNQNYELSFWAANSEPNGDPNDINLEIDGIIAFNTGPLLPVVAALEWKKYAFIFNSGNRTSIEISLRSLETGQGGRDFYLDNVEMQLCSLTGSDISGSHYSDVDRDNIFQIAREAGLSSVGVALYDTRGDLTSSNDIYIGSTDSLSNGLFEFINLPGNPNYQLRIFESDPDLPPGSVLGTQSLLPVALNSGVDSNDNDFGFDIPRPDLMITKNSSVYDHSSSAGFSIPGEDVEYTIEVTNNAGEGMDIDSLLIIDPLPNRLSFYNGDFDGPGSETNDPIVFTQTDEGVDFDYSRDVRFSNALLEPSSFEDCDYMPTAGYDPNVTFLCLNPKGILHNGSGLSNFDFKFRLKIN